MRLHSYEVENDIGFQPNPFWGFLTLADNTFESKRKVKVGDWILGVKPKSKENLITFIMIISEVLSFAEYYEDKRFKLKKPNFTKKEEVYRRGDNIYKPLSNGKYELLQSIQSIEYNGIKGSAKQFDLDGKNVFISNDFYYFGASYFNSPELIDYSINHKYKYRLPKTILDKYDRIFMGLMPGVLSSPSKWPKNDDSWKTHITKHLTI